MYPDSSEGLNKETDEAVYFLSKARVSSFEGVLIFPKDGISKLPNILENNWEHGKAFT